MFGSLDLLQHQLDGSHLRLDRVSQCSARQRSGPITLAATATLEGALFTGCVVAGMLIARQRNGRGG